MGRCLPKNVWLFVYGMSMTSSPSFVKTLLAHAMPRILPEMSIEESLSAMAITLLFDSFCVYHLFLDI
jgi:predicted ATPase with chaperone activity